MTVVSPAPGAQPVAVTPSASGANVGAGGSVSVLNPDGSTADIGAAADAAATDTTSSWSLIALAKATLGALSGAIGLIARGAAWAASTNGSTVAAISRLDGAQVVQIGQIPQLQYNCNYVQLANTNELNIMIPTSGQRIGLHSLFIFNDDTVAHTFTVRSANGSTIVGRFQVDPGKHMPPVIIPQGIPNAVNSNWSVQLGEAVATTGPHVSAYGYIIPG